MKKKPSFTLFVVLFIISLIIFILDHFLLLGSIKRRLESIVAPVESFMLSVSTKAQDRFRFISELPEKDAKLKRLEEEKKELLSLLSELTNLQEENASLRQQLGMTGVNSQNLNSARIIGMTDSMIIDKGRADGVAVGDIVVSKNIVIGKVSDTSEKLARVLPVTSPKSAIPAKAAKTRASGVVKGSLGNIIFDNVTLDTTLEIDDLVQTSGDVNDTGGGYPPGLLIGKIVSVDKSESNLFQRAKLESPVKLDRTRLVFLIKLMR